MAEGYNAGEARLSVVPDSSGFLKKLEADLKSKNAKFAVKITPDTKAATAEIDKWITEQSRKDVRLTVDVDTKAASAKARALEADFGKVFSALKWNAGALAIGNLPAITTALVSVAGAMQQVAGAGLVLPGVFAGIGSSVGVAALGMSGMSDALKAVDKASDGTAKSIAAADAALAKLSTNQADAVKTVYSYKGALDDLKKLSGQNIFAGFSDGFKQLADKDLPTITKGVDGISKALGQNLNQVMQSLGSDSSKGFLDRILGNTGDAQARLTKAIDPIVHAIGTLTAAGSDALPRLADGVGKLADRFDAFITAASADGSLEKWINDGITSVGQLGDTLLNIGNTFTALTKAAGSGDGLIGTLDVGSKKLAEFLNSTEGQNKLKQFFAEGKVELQHLWEIAQQLPGVLQGIFDAGRAASDTFLPVIKEILSVLNAIPGGAQGVVTAFLAWKTIDGITNLAGNIGKVGGALDILPGKASTAATGISGALSRVAVPAWLAFMVAENGPDIQKWAEDHIPGAKQLDSLPTPADAGKATRDWMNNLGKPQPPGPPNNVYGPRGSDSDRIPAPANNVYGPRDSGGDAPLPGHAMGGPTLNRRNGPTGGYIAELHPDEWVLPAHAREAVGDKALWALTEGRRFDQGGPGDLPWYPGLPIPKGPRSPFQPGNFNPGMKIDLSMVDSGQDNAIDILQAAASAGLSGYGSGRTTADWHQYPKGIFPGYHAQDGGGKGKLNFPGVFPAFDGGGTVDENGNPITPGPMPGPAGPIAPNPTSGGPGIINSIIGGVTQGIQGPIGNALALGQGLASQNGGIPGLQTEHGVGTLGVPAAPSIADRAAQLPGIWGLAGSLGSSNPGDNVMDWGSKTSQWLGNFTAKTVGGFATTLWQGGLDFFGLGNSILSPNNSWNQAGRSVGEFAFGSDGPLGQLLGANDGAGSSTGTTSRSSNALDPKKIREAQDRIADKDASLAVAQARLAGLPATASPASRLSAQNAVTTATREAAEARADATTLGSNRASSTGSSYTPPAGSGAQGWRPLVEQIVASRGLGPGWVEPLLRQIQTESGGNPMSRNDHDPNGRGGQQSVAGLFNFLPSTFSGSGGQNIWDPADQINTAITYVQGRYGQTNGVPNWIGTPGRGFAAGGAAGGVNGPGGPKSDLIPAMLSNGEHVFTADDVNAMGGQQSVMAFRQALHRAGGGIIAAGAVPIDPTLMDGGAYRQHRIQWWGGKDGLPRAANPGDPLVPWGPNAQGKMVAPNIFGGLPGEWPPNNNFPRQGDSRDIWRDNRRGVGGFALGGPVPEGAVPGPPPRPNFDPGPGAKQVNPARPPASVAPRQPSGPAAAPPQQAPASVAPQAPGQTSSGGGFTQIAAAPSNLDHNLPALSKGITSAASALGNIASQAIAGGMGGVGLPGGGAAGQFAAGLIQEGGKVVNDIANVGSSFLVGSVPGSFGSGQDRAFGQTVMPQQNVPVTSPLRGGTTVNFNGISDVDRIAQYMDLRDAQARAGLARFGG